MTSFAKYVDCVGKLAKSGNMSQEKLTPFERHLKKVEEKNKREQAEAAELYQEFVRAFAAEEEPEQGTVEEIKSAGNQQASNLSNKNASEKSQISSIGILENKYRQRFCMFFQNILLTFESS